MSERANFNWTVGQIFKLPPDPFIVKAPELSEWKCFLFGSTGTEGIVYRPRKGCEPNWFARLMMRWCFDCRWVRVKDNIP